MSRAQSIFINKVRDFIRHEHLLKHDATYLVGLSGGPDSVALLRVLCGLGYSIEAIHCNFNLRGEESIRDEKFCKDLCQQLDIKFHTVHFDTYEYAKKYKLSIEMAARQLRYNYFEQLLKDLDGQGICVAHHLDDSIETFFINLLRGTGLHGLTGIAPQNGHVLRPMLCVSRSEIMDYLAEIGQSYVVDSSNLGDEYVRNKIRHQVIPLMENMNPAFRRNMSRTLLYLSGAENIQDETVKQAVNDVIVSQKETEILISKTKLQEYFYGEFVLFELLTAYQFSPTQIEEIWHSIPAGVGKRWSSCDWGLLIDRQYLILSIAMSQDLQRKIKIPENGVYVWDEQKKFKFSECKYDESFIISRERNRATLDFNKTAYPLTVRYAVTGDRFVPFGMAGSKLISDYLTDKKRTRFQKEVQLVVEDANGKIIWLVGERTDNRFRVSTSTTTCLCIEVLE
ncbi:tRNA(Ile)-lysidine synthetase [Prevotella sp. DNF00663]|uniref:tRNA lysidine(34) synthetase TilS n=1 Tax=Prevotella sp. DNF00663 TaxID=1384078 RepID=UPI000780DB0D|nr:tRNA lysidine(34) synthetase TilS [Prevotella sp. DNF00663]KXB83441.1 tRNA(Ile)-lysidine synthetase [Prevotella sp. DNF00663]